jgi:hypothetical protein
VEQHEREEATPKDRHRGGPRSFLVPEDDACAAAEASGLVGKRRICTFELPDGCELVSGDRIADAEDGEELRPVSEEAGAEGGPDERAGREGAGQGEAKRRRVEPAALCLSLPRHGQGAAAVSGSPEGGARDEGKEGNGAEDDGESGAGGERGDADEQETGRREGGREGERERERKRVRERERVSVSGRMRA